MENLFCTDCHIELEGPYFLSLVSGLDGIDQFEAVCPDCAKHTAPDHLFDSKMDILVESLTTDEIRTNWPQLNNLDMLEEVDNLVDRCVKYNPFEFGTICWEHVPITTIRTFAEDPDMLDMWYNMVNSDNSDKFHILIQAPLVWWTSSS